MADKKKPGVMLYFDIRPCLQRMTNEQKGVLLSAIMDYAEDGTLPEFKDVAIDMAWAFIQPRIDRDAKTYTDKVEKARASVSKRWRGTVNTDEYGGIRTNTDEYGGIPKLPTTTTTTSTTTSTTSNIRDKADKPPRARFSPPTLEDVTAYCTERKNKVDPQRFISHYDSNGWMVGKNKMKDWRAAVRTWERNDLDKPSKGKSAERDYSAPPGFDFL